MKKFLYALELFVNIIVLLVVIYILIMPLFETIDEKIVMGGLFVFICICCIVFKRVRKVMDKMIVNIIKFFFNFL